jgi:hypothetical protein
MSTRPFSSSTSRVTRFKDGIARLPLRPVGFYHFKTEFYIAPDRKVWKCPGNSGDEESEECINEGWVPVDEKAHRDYFSSASFEYVFFVAYYLWCVY